MNFDYKDLFFKKVILIPFSTCWHWIGAINNIGYGHFRFKRKDYLAHRFSFEFHKNKIPDGLTIDHLCRNRSCVNPDHLEMVTLKVNNLRSSNTLTSINSNKTRCSFGHEYSGYNLIIKKNGWRLCRDCKNRYHRNYYHNSKIK